MLLGHCFSLLQYDDLLACSPAQTHEQKLLLSINETRLDFEGQTFHEDFKGQSREPQNCLLNNLRICQLKTDDTSLFAPYSGHFSLYCHETGSLCKSVATVSLEELWYLMQLCEPVATAPIAEDHVDTYCILALCIILTRSNAFA